MKWKSNLLALAIAALLGWLAGWYFKTPSPNLLRKALRYNAKWRRDDFIEMKRGEIEFFGIGNRLEGVLFDYNFIVACIVFVISAGVVWFLIKKQTNKLYE